MVKWLNCFLVMLLILLATNQVYAESSHPTKTVKIFLQSVVTQDKNVASWYTDDSAQCDKLIDDFIARLSGWPVNSPATFEMTRILEEPKIRLEKIASGKATVIVDCTFAFMGGHLATKEITKEKYSFSLVNRGGVWIIVSGRILSSTSLGYRHMDKLQTWDYTKQKCPPLYQANYAKLLAELKSLNESKLNDRKRKERVANELRPQAYVKGIKTKYIPIMYGWSKAKVEQVLGKVPNSNHNQWNYEFHYLCFGRSHGGGVLDIYFIDNKVYKVMARSSSIGYTFSAGTLDPQLSKIKFNHIVGDPGFVNYNTGQSLIFITTGPTLFASGEGKIKPEDTRVDLKDLGSYIFVYYEVPPYWRGLDMRYGTDLDD